MLALPEPMDIIGSSRTERSRERDSPQHTYKANEAETQARSLHLSEAETNKSFWATLHFRHHLTGLDCIADTNHSVLFTLLRFIQNKDDRPKEGSRW